jgi:hypothetical protein
MDLEELSAARSVWATNARGPVPLGDLPADPRILARGEEISGKFWRSRRKSRDLGRDPRILEESLENFRQIPGSWDVVPKT